MPLILNGTTGVSGVDGSAGTPSYQGNDSNTGIFYPAADTIAFAEGGVEVMRIDSSGNVGIGTNSPASASGSTVLSVGGSSTSTTGRLFLRDSANNNTMQFYQSSGFNEFNSQIELQIRTEAGAMRFMTANAERMRITSGGQLLVGSTGADGNLGATGFQVTSAETAAIVRVTNASGQAMRFFTSTTTQAGFITVNGTTTTYNSASDYRLKDNVQPLTNALDTVAKLKPVTFTWKHDGRDDNGFIAHELQEVLPNAVTGDKDAVNKDGSIQAQGIDQRNIVATLTAALQEAHGLIKDLQAKVAALEK